MIFLEQLPSLFEYHKVAKQLNLQAITIWVTKQKFLIAPNLNKSRIPTVLEVNRQTQLIKQHINHNAQEYKNAKSFYFSAMIGIISLGNKKIIILAQEVNLIGSIGKRDVFRITKPVYLFYDPNDKKTLTDSEAEILLNTTTIFEQGMYFSFSYDLALRMNEIQSGQKNQKRFNWAYQFQKELEIFDPMWRISIIQGFVGRLQLHINGLKLQMILISRRATKRGGTQHFARGIDSHGNAGNYVQTEQILIMKDYYFSFLQIRGMAPLKWQQQKSSYGFSKVKFSGTIDQNYSSFKNHLKLIEYKTSFRYILLLNLLSSQKQQKKIVENYEYLVKKLKQESKTNEDLKSSIFYAYFDIHSNCANKNYQKLNIFLEKTIGEVIEKFNFTALMINKQDKKIEQINTQTGVIRSNCFNCIDRTNIAQSRIAALKLIQILKYLQIEIKQLSNSLEFLSENTPFANLYRNLWADNGDALSKQYTGTGSTESFAVRKGKLSYMTTLDHGMKSIFRAIRNISNQDQKKQKAIHFILGDEQELEDEGTEEILKSQKDEEISIDQNIMIQKEKTFSQTVQ